MAQLHADDVEAPVEWPGAGGTPRCSITRKTCPLRIARAPSGQRSMSSPPTCSSNTSRRLPRTQEVRQAGGSPRGDRDVQRTRDTPMKRRLGDTGHGASRNVRAFSRTYSGGIGHSARSHTAQATSRGASAPFCGGIDVEQRPCPLFGCGRAPRYFLRLTQPVGPSRSGDRGHGRRR